MTETLGGARWRPTASWTTLQQGAALRRALRNYFDALGVLEVQTPVLSGAAISDPAIESLSTRTALESAPRWLHTSPEFPMKRLLVAYPQCIWQLVPVFRDDERGRYHNPEFTLLEWYRVGLNHHALMSEITVLVQHLADVMGRELRDPVYHRYGECVRERLGVFPEAATVEMIAEYFRSHDADFPDGMGADLDAALVLFFDVFVIPSFPEDRLSLLYDYPVSQAALARLGTDQAGRAIAERFELYGGAVELGNGFHELSDGAEQRQRFEQDLQVRQRRGQRIAALDEHLLSALEHGLPDCAGVAVGFERLLMWLGGHAHIDEVVAFPFERA